MSGVNRRVFSLGALAGSLLGLLPFKKACCCEEPVDLKLEYDPVPMLGTYRLEPGNYVLTHASGGHLMWVNEETGNSLPFDFFDHLYHEA